MKPTRGRKAPLAAALIVAVLAAGCSDENPWVTPPGGGDGDTGDGIADVQPPTVDILFPNEESGTVAVGDSVFVRVHVTDSHALAEVLLEGFSIRGNPDLGTDVRVERFAAKNVNLRGVQPAVRDTVLDRFLLAAADTLPEQGVFIVATARDTAGNVAADTARVDIGGPRVSIVSPTVGTEFRAGQTLTVRVSAEDRIDLVSSVRVRTSGAFSHDVSLAMQPAVAAVDTSVVIPIPQAAEPGPLRITASVTSGSNRTATGAPVDVVVQGPQPDLVPPRTTFTTEIPARAEHGDEVSLTVSAVDETRVDSVGFTVLVMRATATGRDTLRVVSGGHEGENHTFRFDLDGMGLNALDTASVELEVTAWAKDPAGNCGAATSPNSPQSLECVAGPQGSRLSTGPGRLIVVFLGRGQTVLRPNVTDVIADLVADDQNLYLSNYSRNRVDVLPIGSGQYAPPVLVGSRPWGLALGRTGDTLFVGNSGGTNISVVPLGTPVLSEAASRRIFVPNERLFSVTFSNVGAVTGVFAYDFSDRPQFLGQAANGLIVYSTKPTAAAPDGTVRIWDGRAGRSEIVTTYADRHAPGQGLIVNADSAFFLPETREVLVYPRRRPGDAAPPAGVEGSAQEVSAVLTQMRSQPPNAAGYRYDTRLDLGANIETVGLSDTTFVATSTDRRYVAVGEGIRQNARIPLFEAAGDSLVQRGDVRDLISNTAERVIGLGLNHDGSLGVARGDQAYYFDHTLRLQGHVFAGTPTGGVAMHPQNGNYPTGADRVSFVSGVDAFAPYVDVIDTFNFFRIRRIYIRDPVIGSLVVAPRAAGDPATVALRLYALTAGGVLTIPVLTADFQQ